MPKAIHSNNTDIPTRAMIVALKSYGRKNATEIAKMSGKTCSTVNRIYSKALERGFEPNVLPVCLKLEHLQDGPRSGRPVMADQHIQEAVINKAKEVHSERALNLNAISEGLSLDGLKIGKTTIWRILKDSGFKKKKARELFQ